MTEIFLISTGLSTLIALILSLIFGHLTESIALLSLLLGIGAGVGHWYMRLRGKEQHFRGAGTVDRLILFFIGCFIYLQFAYLLYRSDLSLSIGNQNNLGDLPFHINLIKSFAKGLQFWPQNIEWSGVPLRYPFGMDFFNSLFEILGIHTQAHLFVVGFISGLFLLRELRLYSGVFLVMAFFLSGGWENLDTLLRGTGAWSTSAVDFKNLFLAVFVTQRGFLWALPAGLYLLRRWEKISSQDCEISELLVFIFVLGVMPLFHLHTAFFFFVYFGLRLVANFLQNRKLDKIKSWLYLACLLAAIPLLYKLMAGGNQQVSNAIGWMAFWNWQDGSLIDYWFKNFFVLSLILPALIYYCWRHRVFDPLIGILVFILFVKVRLAPWAWDNIKLLIWAYIVVMRDFEVLVLPRLKLKKVLLGLVVFIPGFYQLLSSLPQGRHSATFPVPAWLLDCREVANGFGINQAVIMAPDYDHPLLFLGAKSYFGYEGHVWSHGYDLAERRQKVFSLLRLIQLESPTVLEEAQKMGVSWLVWGPREAAYYRKNAEIELDSKVLQKFSPQPICETHLQTPPAGLEEKFGLLEAGESLYDLSKFTGNAK